MCFSENTIIIVVSETFKKGDFECQVLDQVSPAAKGVQQKESGKKVMKKGTEASEKVTEK